MDERPPHAPIRAVFLDIDGTLVGADPTISPGVKRAITTARERGCEIVLCTGRARYTTQPIADQIAPPYGYAVTSNGGVAMHLGTGEVLYRRLLPIPVALDILRMMMDAGADPYVYEDATGDGIEAARVLHHPEGGKGHWVTRPRYRPHATILDDLPFAPVSVNTYGPPEQIRPLARHLEEVLPHDVRIIESGTEREWGVEVFVSGVSKRAGLEAVAARLHVAREEIMAIGDHINDLEMIEWAGLGVAMGNAQPEVKAIADWVTAPLDEDGVAHAIEAFVLKP